MTQEFKGIPQQIALVTSLAEDVYKLYAYHFEKPYETIHQSHYCIGMSRDLITFLELENIRGVLMKSPERRDLPFHTFVKLDNFWITDPNWQQFLVGHLPKKSSPKVLIEQRILLTRTLRRYGIPKVLHPIWTQAILFS